jgi:hypothetical protein
MSLMLGTLPESMGDMVSLKELWISYYKEDWGEQFGSPNKFEGSLPLSFGKLTKLTYFTITVPTLTGPLPDLSGLNSLRNCEFMPSGICRPFGWNAPKGSSCDFTVFPVCYEMSSDCQVLNDWQPDFLEDANCCEDSHVECRLDRIISLNLSSIVITSIPYSLSKLTELEILDLSNTGINGSMPFVLSILVSLRVLNLGLNYLSGSISVDIGNLINLRVLNLERNSLSGQIPESLKFLVLLEELYLANNDGLTGTIPNLSQLRIIDVDDGIAVRKDPSFSQEAQGLETDQSASQESSQVLIVALSLGAAFIVLVAVGIILFSRYKRKSGETAHELDFLNSEQAKIVNKDIVLICKLNSGGFGTIWKARYKGEIVAIKRMNVLSDDLPEKNRLGKMFFKEVTMIQQMKHDRIVKFISFEIESFSLIIELMPLGSLQSYIKKHKSNEIKWIDRYQLMLDICEGMAFLHSSIDLDGRKKAQLFHQDLKSGNVLLEKVRGRLRGKIADFGLSRK